MVKTELDTNLNNKLVVKKSYNDAPSINREYNQLFQDYLISNQELTCPKIVNLNDRYDPVLGKSDNLDKFSYLQSQLTEKDKSLISPKVLKKANNLIEKIKSIAKVNCLWWSVPLINVTEAQEIVLEWWNKTKKITIYIDQETIDYIKVWGPDMDNEMEEGSITLDQDLKNFWNWIN
ncbi:MAG: hypothetical protein DSM107014_11115 [Gomphosphaeria aponina SAG 52.96 = DSM 107014]|uniref:Uncharacterized protein n=1 Tax=Gomphosphaeria aponina SAG 52.96 = DSM 107014 TaxID=1521640 RepID=A0A941GQF7_9CHRO|nr:hypothetical protein [Gomphosphaeria aponina SAG 52.96 = DSM 107014]